MSVLQVENSKMKLVLFIACIALIAISSGKELRRDDKVSVLSGILETTGADRHYYKIFYNIERLLHS